MLELNRTYNFDCIEGLRLLDDESVNCCVTSPPYYGLRDYGCEGQIGLEPTLEEYIKRMVEVFREVRRVLRSDGTLWLNLGDSYAGSGKGRNADKQYNMHSLRTKPKQASQKGVIEGEIPNFIIPAGIKQKDLMGVPWRVAFALQNDGWYLRQDIIWHKPNCMPESVTDRCTKSHEYIFLLSKSARYYFDNEAIKVQLAESTSNDMRLYDMSSKTRRPERGYPGQPSQGTGMLKPKGITDPPRGSKGVLGNQHKGNRKTFRGGGAYTEGKAFDNSAIVPADSHGNMPNILEKRNRRSVWTVSTAQNKASHYATFPEELIKPCILAGCPEGGVVCDPFAGTNTTGKVANDTGRDFICFDIVKKYCDMANKKTRQIRIKVEEAYAARV